ncbi:MAG: hypothetical protein M3Q63_02820 [bacterium]|nr:hypothetical protein [bacterium]
MKFLTPLLFIALAGGAFYWFINPIYKDIGILRDKTEKLDAAIIRARNAVAKKDDLIVKLNSFGVEDRSRLEKLIPNNVDNIRLIVDLNSIAAKYGAGIKNIKVSENNSSGSLDQSSDIKPYGSLTLSFATRMSYDNFIRYIIDLQQNLRLSDITGVDFKSDNSGLYDYVITLKTYVMR